MLILRRPLGPAGGPPFRLPVTPSQEWLAANAAVPGHYGAAPAAFLDLLGRIRRPPAFVSVEHRGEVAAIGMAVADGSWVGLFEVGTLPRHRRHGLATAAMERLLAWGTGQGARAAYLQVMDANAPARALYSRLGFQEAYRYWYRVGV